METIFLVGGSGFIGKNLARCFADRYNVSVYDKFIDQDFFSSYPSIKTFELDLVEDTIPPHSSTPDYIINLASIVTAERDMSLFDGLISSNLKILLNLYERFKDEKQLKLFIQFGSSEEYGAENSPFKEENRESPSSPYALVKQLTTNTAMMLYQNYGFPMAIVRPGNLFGPLQNKSKFIPYVIEQLKRNLPLNVSPCEQKRDFIYIDDFVFAIERILQNYLKCLGQIINVSSGESLSLKEIIEFCKQILQSTSEVHYGALPYRANEVMDLKCSVSKLSQLIGLEIDFDNKKRLIDYLK